MLVQPLQTRRQDSNLQPSRLERPALPLSYGGKRLVSPRHKAKAVMASQGTPL